MKKKIINAFIAPDLVEACKNTTRAFDRLKIVLNNYAEIRLKKIQSN